MLWSEQMMSVVDVGDADWVESTWASKAGRVSGQSTVGSKAKASSMAFSAHAMPCHACRRRHRQFTGTGRWLLLVDAGACDDGRIGRPLRSPRPALSNCAQMGMGCITPNNPPLHNQLAAGFLARLRIAAAVLEPEAEGVRHFTEACQQRGPKRSSGA